MRDFVPFPPIGRHGVIGDRRTAALVAADGTMDWLCLPDYDDDPFFSCLLDARAGGWWRMGPDRPAFGRQRYVDGTAVLETSWRDETGTLELTDAMAWPDEERPEGHEPRRVLLRRLRCTSGEFACSVVLAPRDMLVPDVRFERVDAGLVVNIAGRRRPSACGIWSSRELQVDDGRARASASVRLRAGESLWMVLAADEAPARWSVRAAEEALTATARSWREWLSRFELPNEHAGPLARSLIVLHLLGYAPSGSMVAAPTLGLPERIGGPRNYDYRYAWIRDASLSVTGLSIMGDVDTAGRYLQWLSRLGSRTHAPLQVVYDVHGREKIQPHRWRGAEGYRDSTPITIGNRAYEQRQNGSLGYVAECMWTILDHGARWRPTYSRLMARLARHACEVWDEPDSGVWELKRHQQFVASKVMCWVVLDRAARIAARVGGFDANEVAGWRRTALDIHAAILQEGYDERGGSFVQRFGSRALDASVLLVSVTGFLPPDDARVLSTLDRIDEVLGLDGFIYRFEPETSEGEKPLPVGQYEGAFLPCTFWMATARARAGQIDRAQQVIERVQHAAGELGLFAEEIDPRAGEWLGNYPLLFSHVEHVRAIHALESARSATHARSTLVAGLGPGRIAQRRRAAREDVGHEQCEHECEQGEARTEGEAYRRFLDGDLHEDHRDENRLDERDAQRNREAEVTEVREAEHEACAREHEEHEQREQQGVRARLFHRTFPGTR